jgi:hypothetical protein
LQIELEQKPEASKSLMSVSSRTLLLFIHFSVISHHVAFYRTISFKLSQVV